MNDVFLSHAGISECIIIFVETLDHYSSEGINSTTFVNSFAL